ncbi:MAG: PilZ domain-containing protein [Candidatus Cloacimonetes bacterium]|nr:PilZ domain-containing protein [Candidatus Cloacimonadota bacterium]
MKSRPERASLTYYPTIRNLRDDTELGHLIDLSPEGMKMLSEKPVKTDTYYHLSIDVRSDKGLSRELAVEAKSLWSKRDINPDFYDTGFTFHNLTAAAHKIIARLMREYPFNG